MRWKKMRRDYVTASVLMMSVIISYKGIAQDGNAGIDEATT